MLDMVSNMPDSINCQISDLVVSGSGGAAARRLCLQGADMFCSLSQTFAYARAVAL